MVTVLMLLKSLSSMKNLVNQKRNRGFLQNRRGGRLVTDVYYSNVSGVLY